ncbi:MAG: hypothetical protein P8Y47_14185 [Alphaproteobacteria bacterium]
MNEDNIYGPAQAKHTPQEASPKEEVEAHAHLEKYLAPGERLIWADKAVSSRLVFHYLGRIASAVAYIPVFLLLAGLVYLELPFLKWLIPSVILVGLLIFLYFIATSVWGIVHYRSHYYGMSKRRIFIAIGPYAPRIFTKQDFDYTRIYGPEDMNKRGKIYFYTIKHEEDDPGHYIKFRFYGIKNAHWVEELVQKQLTDPMSSNKDD